MVKLTTAKQWFKYGLVPNRWQTSTWTNADPIYWRIYAAPREDELIRVDWWQLPIYTIGLIKEISCQTKSPKKLNCNGTTLAYYAPTCIHWDDAGITFCMNGILTYMAYKWLMTIHIKWRFISLLNLHNTGREFSHLRCWIYHFSYFFHIITLRMRSVAIYMFE